MIKGLVDGIHHAIQNPFGLDFVVKENEIYVPFGSVINCIGYNDYLEKIVGVARMAFAAIAIAKSDDKKEKLLAAGHLIRGVMEMMGNFEFHLLVLDIAFTLYNIGKRVFFPPKTVFVSAAPMKMTKFDVETDVKALA